MTVRPDGDCATKSGCGTSNLRPSAIRMVNGRNGCKCNVDRNCSVVMEELKLTTGCRDAAEQHAKRQRGKLSTHVPFQPAAGALRSNLVGDVGSIGQREGDRQRK